MLRISTLNEHRRMSTQELLQIISQAVENGETDFHIAASGQHDIGGPLWNRAGETLRFTVSNPGQRVGSMCLPNTEITVEGSAPADVGWLNSGGRIAVRGDAGDTAGHCAAGGKIFIGGRAGTRSGSLMKQDPLQAPPELWILNNVGSFSFEFMSGGRAVVCGHDSQTLPSVLGDRPCVGMVGGVIYFRGRCPSLPDDVVVQPLNQRDLEWLDSGLDEFLEAVDRQKLKRELSIWKHWQKLVPVVAGGALRLSMAEFHALRWIPGGLFGDVLEDDQRVIPLVPTGNERLAAPLWSNEHEKCEDCRLCVKACPQSAIKRRGNAKEAGTHYEADGRRCIGCGFCAAVCPASVWQMKAM